MAESSNGKVLVRIYSQCISLISCCSYRATFTVHPPAGGGVGRALMHADLDEVGEIKHTHAAYDKLIKRRLDLIINDQAETGFLAYRTREWLVLLHVVL